MTAPSTTPAAAAEIKRNADAFVQALERVSPVVLDQEFVAAVVAGGVRWAAASGALAGLHQTGRLKVTLELLPDDPPEDES